MQAFSYGGYFYLDDIDESQKRYNENFIRRIFPDIITMTSSSFLRKYLIKLTRIYVENVIVSWMQQNFTLLQNFQKCMRGTDKFRKTKIFCLQKMILKKILDYCDYSILFNVIS